MFEHERDSRADNDSLCHRIVSFDDPDTFVLNNTPVTIGTLKTTHKEEEEAHGKTASEKHRTATPLVDIDDCGDGQSDVEDVLNRLVGNNEIKIWGSKDHIQKRSGYHEFQSNRHL